jgi:hypothetical protein
MMALSNVAGIDDLARTHTLSGLNADEPQGHASAVSWGAITAGAAGAAALSLILLVLGTGLGLSSVSPWSNEGITAKTFGVSSILWITLTQLAAAGMGGYLAGRLRKRWAAADSDEVYFRDTAHGFLAWAVATLASAALLTSVIGSIVSGGVQAGASVAGGVATTATAATAGGVAASGSTVAKTNSDNGPMGYFVDSLFRRDGPATASVAADQGAAASATEVPRIFMNAIGTGSLPAEDARYVGQIVAQRTGLTQQDAEKRVTDTYVRLQTKLREAEAAAKEAADKARKASAYAALWLFVSLLGGAFIASWAATFGGRRRDF